ncbi:hypothetical protein BDV35DRAFT_385097 [Aspergillus flavus]|uniref:Uncharacterized protein n=1 Tax=Aspergillus flavus TaxID=5059 RepID=A0A5N6GFV0_ASPFL|nr:hypothetical protein BDV35DRAFT_385097 [Aspergillus flavus]
MYVLSLSLSLSLSLCVCVCVHIELLGLCHLLSCMLIPIDNSFTMPVEERNTYPYEFTVATVSPTSGDGQWCLVSGATLYSLRLNQYSKSSRLSPVPPLYPDNFYLREESGVRIVYGNECIDIETEISNAR